MPTSDIKKGPLYVDSTNNRVGIKTAAPDLALHVEGTNAAPASSGSTPTGFVSLRQKDGGSSHGANIGVLGAPPWGTWIQGQDANNLATSYPLLLNPNGGNVGIGTTSPSRQLEIYDDGTNGQAVLALTAQNTENSRIMFADTDDNNIGILDYNHSDDSMRFFANNAERMRLTSDGSIFYGTTSNVGTGSVGVAIDAGDNFMIRSGMSGTATQDRMRFYNSNGLMGWIQTTGSACTYQSASDYRLKENVTADWDATTRLKQLNPVRFNFTFESDNTVDGFLAHEVQSVVPEAVSGTHNEVDDEGNPVYQGIDQSKLTPLLTKALIEAVEKIEQLEARIAALEAN